MKNPIDEVSASHLIDDAAYIRQLHSTRRQVWCPFARYPAVPGRGHYTTFSDLRCNVACLFVMLRPIAVIFIRLRNSSTLWSSFHRSGFSRRRRSSAARSRRAVRFVVAARSPVHIGPSLVKVTFLVATLIRFVTLTKPTKPDIPRAPA